MKQNITYSVYRNIVHFFPEVTLIDKVFKYITHKHGVVSKISIAEFIQAITDGSEQLYVCQNFCPHTFNFLS